MLVEHMPAGERVMRPSAFHNSPYIGTHTKQHQLTTLGLDLLSKLVHKVNRLRKDTPQSSYKYLQR